MRRWVSLPADLVVAAHVTSTATGRSLEAQLARWIKMGRKVDTEPEELARKGISKLGRILDEVGTPKGRRRLERYLKSTPYPHFEGVPGRPEILIRIDKDGTRTRGKIVGRRFKPC